MKGQTGVWVQGEDMPLRHALEMEAQNLKKSRSSYYYIQRWRWKIVRCTFAVAVLLLTSITIMSQYWQPRKDSRNGSGERRNILSFGWYNKQDANLDRSDISGLKIDIPEQNANNLLQQNTGGLHTQKLEQSMEESMITEESLT